MPRSLLFLDPRLVASTANAKLELGAVQKHPANPLFVEDFFAEPPKRWEARLDNVYPSVIYDEDDGLFKCWYKSFIYDEPSNNTALAQRPSQPYRQGAREEGLQYAVSADGINLGETGARPHRLRRLGRQQPGHAPRDPRAACWRRLQRPARAGPGAEPTNSSIAMPARAEWRPASPPMGCAGLSRNYGPRTTPSATATTMRFGRPSARATSASRAAGRMASARSCAAKAPTSSNGQSRSRLCAAPMPTTRSIPCRSANMVISTSVCPRFSTKATSARPTGTRSTPNWRSASTASIGSGSARARR